VRIHMGTISQKKGWGGMLVVLALLAVPPAYAQSDCVDLSCAYNPDPDKDDFLLPMPGNFQMAFRKVAIPGGAEFWGSQNRLAKVGDILGAGGDTAIFEGVQRLPVAGSFTNGQSWYYYLGKYEVTVGQYLAVLGAGDLKAGVEALKQRGGDPELIRKLKDAATPLPKDLAQPLRLLGWLDYQDFIDRYNLWCYQSAACRDRLPYLPQRLERGSPPSETPGFLRLPTDLEWEYAARGGTATLGTPRFEETLPFPVAESRKYAWAKDASHAKGPTRIGRLRPTHGFYDLFGNVQELTLDPFRADLIQGKVGGLCARGGGFLDYDPQLRVSQRAEIPLYQAKGGALVKALSPTTGIRLAIGSLVVESPRYRDDLVTQYKDYLTGFRKSTPAGSSTVNSFTQARDVSLREAFELLAAIDATHPGDTRLKGQVAKVRRHLEIADRKIDDGITDVADKLTGNALIVLKTAGWYAVRRDESARLMEKIKGMQISGRTAQLDAQERKREEFKKGFKRNFDHYADTVERLQGYPTDKVSAAIDAFAAKYRRDRPYVEACRLLRAQLAAPVNRALWRQQVEAIASTPGIYQ
jgi:formylglycine-generating enzyme required for sulfatase activity